MAADEHRVVCRMTRSTTTSGTNFAGADVTGANFASSNSEGGEASGMATGLTQKQIDTANGDSTTKLPPGLHMPAHWKKVPAKGE